MTSTIDVDPAVTGQADLRLAARRTTPASEVTLNGWVNRRRDLGGLIFIDLRDRYGMTQVVFNPQIAPRVPTQIASDCAQRVCAARARISSATGRRAPRTRSLPTGEIEVEAHDRRVLNEAKTPPFYINEEVDVDEGLRLKYRYLDLRRPQMQRNIILRHRLVKYMRDYLDERGFVEVETPLPDQEHARRRARLPRAQQRLSRARSTPCRSRRSR